MIKILTLNEKGRGTGNGGREGGQAYPSPPTQLKE